MPRTTPAPDDIESASDVASVLAEVNKRDITRFTAEMDSTVLEAEVDYWNGEEQQSFQYRIRHEVSLGSGNQWFHIRKSNYGTDGLPDDWMEVWSSTRRR